MLDTARAGWNEEEEEAALVLSDMIAREEEDRLGVGDRVRQQKKKSRR